ncbi:MAG: FAD-dependent oxidoreductase [Pseudomonadota bacterium]
MARDSRYDVLFEPVEIGPVTSKNRFYQVPHCSGMGFAMPETLNRMREIKAEGGWGVVCTEYCSIHPSSDDQPYPYCTMWDDADVKTHAAMTEAVHRHGALAGVELWYGGYSSANHLSRAPSLGPDSVPSWHGTNQTRAMDKTDIKNFRRWHREAALRSKEAGFDIVYVYAAHGYLPAQFLSPLQNQRTDEYGGSFENRARLIKELLEDTKDAVGDTCGVVIRFAVDNLDVDAGVTKDGDGRALVEYLAEMPDLWDVNIANFPADARTSRFAEEGHQESYIDFVKQVTTKPVVGVGRYTSADRMVSVVNKGIMDMIGAARPSIADPYLPKKIEEGRIEDVRECIGCNVCIMGDGHGAPIRCTQNPTMGEEWRRDWHPEIMTKKASDAKVLVVGAGPAGLEATRALANRGYDVALAEATSELGGRVTKESSLPGLSAWSRVRDYRTYQIEQLGHVEIYRDSELDADQILEFGFDHVCIATGSTWRQDGVGRSSYRAMEGWDNATVLTPDDIMAGTAPNGPVVVYDDDNFYMGGVIAEAVKAAGHDTTLVTTDGIVSSQAHGTLDQDRIQARILELGINVVTSHTVQSVANGVAVLACAYSGREQSIPCATLVNVTARRPHDGLYKDLMEQESAFDDAGIRSVSPIGDCNAPGLIAAAVHAGHLYARTLDGDDIVKRDRVAL